MAKGEYLIPFDKQGNLLSWPGNDRNVVWRENFSFASSLRYVGYSGGRSSMTMEMESLDNGKTYYMFWTFFDQCIRRQDNGPGPIFYGRWTFCKRGTNYSVCPAN